MTTATARPESRTNCSRFTLRATFDELAAIREAAAQKGIPASALVRQALRAQGLAIDP